MLIDIVDRSDNVIGTIERKDALEAGVNFRVAHVFVLNDDGLLLIQQIPVGKRHAGYWGSSVAGYVYSGENYEQAAARRLREELGIHGVLQLISKTTFREHEATKFISLFGTHSLDQPKPNRSEVAAIEWIDIDLVDHLTKTGVHRFTPTFLHLARTFRNGRYDIR
jgi:isopentenyldiphosphate isomerase